jgi:hypothetical protein
MKLSGKFFRSLVLVLLSFTISLLLIKQPGEAQSVDKREIIASQLSGFRLVTAYNRDKNTFASLGIKNRLYIDSGFSKLEGYFVATAWAEYHLAVNNSKVRECMAKYSTKTINSKGVSSSRSGVKYLPETTRLPFNVYIRRYSKKSFERGWAEISSTGGNKLELNLNAYPISGGDSENKTTTKETAGIIGHELLHVYGFDHDEVNGDDFSPVFGNDVYESGWCIARDGVEKSPNTFGLTEDGSISDKFVD